MKIYVVLFALLSCESALLENECLDRVKTAKSVGASCSEQLKILCSHHDILFTLWDASSKIIRTGMTATSEKDLGYYDLCMTVDTRIENTNILGKFCPYQWVTVLPRKDLEELVAVLEISHDTPNEVNKRREELQINSKEDESKNITLIGSLCITSECSPQEYNEVFRTHFFPAIPFNNYDCVTKYTGRDLTIFQLLITLCLALVVVIMISCTITHVIYYYSNKGKPNHFIEGFSALRNGSKLISISYDSVNQIQCMNGLRFISMLWIVAGHGFLTAETRPLVNQKDAIKWESAVYSQYIQSAIFAVDTFFFLSGFLLTYGYLKQMKNRSAAQQLTEIPLIYLNRYLRLTPALGAMFLTSVSFYKLIGDGPLWNIAFDSIKKPCTQYWWRFFLYMQNFYPNDLCFTQTWYLSADMQMFIFAPLVLIPVSRYFEKRMRYVIAGLIILIGSFMGITIAVPYIIENYSNNYDTHSRLSGYLVGIIGGVIFIDNRGKKIEINKVINIILWMCTLSTMMFLAFCNYYVTKYDPTKLKSTLYIAFYRPIWCTCMLWIVFSCYHGYGGFVNWFLSNPLFQIGAKLSYCMYVLHVLIIFYSVGTTRTNSYFSDYEMVNLVWGYINNCIVISIFWTLTFEGPMIMFNRMLLRWIASTKNTNQHKRGAV